MKYVAITQRIDIQNNERRDALDQRWLQFLCTCDLIPILIPNNLKLVKCYIDQFKFSGIILTGGNDLVAYGGDAPERDEVELYLLEYAIRTNTPLLGVCRGMQVIQHHFGVVLSKVAGHVAEPHKVKINGIERLVNSFHKFGAKDGAQDLEVLATASDGVIESVKHKKYLLRGIMWHPERESNFSQEDINLIKDMFQVVKVS